MESDRQSEPRCASMSLIRYTLFSARIAIECGPRRSTLPLQAGMASLQRVASELPRRVLVLPTSLSQRDSHAHWVAFSDVAANGVRRIAPRAAARSRSRTSRPVPVLYRLYVPGTGKKTPGGAGTHTGHTGHTDEPHNHPLKPKPNDTANPDAACPPYAPRTQRIGCAPALRSATLGCSFPRSPLPATSGRSPVRLSSIRETGVRAVLPHRPLRSRCSRSARAVGLSRRPIEADTGHTTPLPGSCVLSFPFPHTCQMPTSCTHRMGFGLRASAGHRRAGPMSARTARLRRVPAYSLRSGQNAHPPRAIPATTRGT